MESRIAAYNEFQSIRRHLSRNEVVKRVSTRHGISKTTVYQWFRGGGPIGRRAGTIARVPELLYVLGALLGDGCLYHWRNRFQVWLVGEAEFTEKYANKLSVCLGRNVKHYKYGSKNAWFVRIDNSELFFLFRSVRNDHASIGKLADEIDSRRGRMEFIEGVFDAEGCVKIIRGKGRKTPKTCLDICNTDLDLLLIVMEAMRTSLGIESRISTQSATPGRKRCYHLRVYSKAGVQRFLGTLHTTKLTKQKQAIVEMWLAKKG